LRLVIREPAVSPEAGEPHDKRKLFVASPHALAQRVLQPSMDLGDEVVLSEGQELIAGGVQCDRIFHQSAYQRFACRLRITGWMEILPGRRKRPA